MSGPIRILQVVTHMNRGGLETMIMNYYRHIDREKVQFDFLVHREARADYDDEIEAMGGKIFRLPRLVPWDAGYRRALDHFFSAHPEYRIVHVHQDCMSGVILKAAQKYHVPVRIAHSHNSNQDKNLKYPIKLLLKRGIPGYATELFACGRDAGDWMFGGAAYRVVNNAIDAKVHRWDPEGAEKVRREWSIPEDALVVGHVGRFCTVKNHTYIVEIFSEILRKKPNSRLLLVGDGELRGQIEQKVNKLGLCGNVIFVGLRSDVPELMQAMDVFLFPSLYEGLPLTLVEAQAAGVPCVISKNIPADCDLTALVHRMALEEPPELWAEAAIEAAFVPKADTYAQICAAGFDITNNAQWLERFYLERWNSV